MKIAKLEAEITFTQDEENELQRLVRKIKYNQPTFEDMEKADKLTRKKWEALGLIKP